VSADMLLKCWIGEDTFNPKAGAAILLLFSVALVPLLERLILKQTQPAPPQ